LYNTIEGSMRVVEAEKELYIVAKFNHEWHRGQVIEVATPVKCKVRYLKIALMSYNLFIMNLYF